MNTCVNIFAIVPTGYHAILDITAIIITTAVFIVQFEMLALVYPFSLYRKFINVSANNGKEFLHRHYKK